MKHYRVREKISDDILADLLHYRNISDTETFLNPDYEAHIHDPFLLQDMDKAVERILSALKQKERIAIFADYDADGVPGAVILADFFKKIGHDNYTVYIPHRNDEGYGLNVEALQTLHNDGATLVITIDCGISNHKEIAAATALGLEVIVTDHHLPHETLPQAFAIINPKRLDDTYPDKNLCGSGVIWKVICALIASPARRRSSKTGALDDRLLAVPIGYEKWLLDMVGLATLSDMVPLVGENRVLARYGLRVLQQTRRPGLQKLFEMLKVRPQDVNEDDVAFLITPRINAASRMGHALDAFNCLSETDYTQAATLAEHLNKINDERKGVVGGMVRDIKQTIAKREDALRNVIVLGNPEWKPSLLGLVANSFSDEHNRPVFLWGRGESESVLKGSCRSSGEINIMALMEANKDILTEYGGHKQAGGFSILQDNIHMLEERLNATYDLLVSEPESQEVTWIDRELLIADIDWKLYSIIEKFAPFGMNNPKPLFLFTQSEIVSTKQFGKEKNHLEIMLKHPKGKPIQAISFFSGPEKFGQLEVGKCINLIAHVEKSTFRNFPELRLRIVDVVS